MSLSSGFETLGHSSNIFQDYFICKNNSMMIIVIRFNH